MSTIYRGTPPAKGVHAGAYASTLAAQTCDLRHACLSTWLSAGVDSTLVAKWAGHSVAVLLRVYAKCLDNRKEVAKSKIEALVPLRPKD